MSHPEPHDDLSYDREYFGCYQWDWNELGHPAAVLGEFIEASRRSSSLTAASLRGNAPNENRRVGGESVMRRTPIRLLQSKLAALFIFVAAENQDAGRIGRSRKNMLQDQMHGADHGRPLQ